MSVHAWTYGGAVPFQAVGPDALVWETRPHEDDARHAMRLDNGPMTEPRYPRYRVLTGPDDDRFCERVSEALDLGYELHGGPALTSHNGNAYVAQSLLWTATTPPPFRPDAESQ